MTGNRRLTPPQSRRVNSLAKKSCCNCDNGKCMLLDDGEECVCGTVESRRYATLYCMRCCLCVKLQPCEILPGLQEAYYPETGCRAYAEKTRPYYAIEGKTARFTRRSGRVSCMGKGLIPNPVKMGFYCVTDTKIHIYDGAWTVFCWLSTPCFFCLPLVVFHSVFYNWLFDVSIFFKD